MPMRVIANILIEYGMGMALDLGFKGSLVRALNEARYYSVGIPVPKTAEELDMYRIAMDDPRLDPPLRESLRIITTVYDPKI